MFKLQFNGEIQRYKIRDTRYAKSHTETRVFYLVSCISVSRISYLFDKPKFENIPPFYYQFLSHSKKNGKK